MNALSTLVAELRPSAEQLVQVAEANGLRPRVTSTYRTYAEQKALYEKYLAGQSSYPASPPGQGSHELGWAFDLVVQPMEYLEPLGELWESWGGTWGGRWRNPDVIHFELPNASQVARQLAASGQFPGIAKGARPSGGFSKALGLAADMIIGLVPAIGAVELGSWLYSLGYPDSEIAAFLSGPFEYAAAHR